MVKAQKYDDRPSGFLRPSSGRLGAACLGSQQPEMEPPKGEVLQMENLVARLTATAHGECLQDKASRLDSPSNQMLHFKIPATSPARVGNANAPTFLWQGTAETRRKQVYKVQEP